MATVGAESLMKEYTGRHDDLIVDFIQGRHDYGKGHVREVLGDMLYQECCKRRVDKVLHEHADKATKKVDDGESSKVTIEHITIGNLTAYVSRLSFAVELTIEQFHTMEEFNEDNFDQFLRAKGAIDVGYCGVFGAYLFFKADNLVDAEKILAEADRLLP